MLYSYTKLPSLLLETLEPVGMKLLDRAALQTLPQRHEVPPVHVYPPAEGRVERTKYLRKLDDISRCSSHVATIQS